MSISVDELGENAIVNAEEDLLKDKCFCVRWFYRASRRQFTCLYFGSTTLAICLLIAGVLLLDKMGNHEGLIHVLVILAAFAYSSSSLWLWHKFQEKEDRMKNFQLGREETPANQQRRWTMTPDEEEELIEKLLQKAQSRRPTTAREDSSSTQGGGADLLIPIISEGGDSHATRQLTSIQIHHAPVGSQQSLKSSDTSGQVIQHSAANSESQDSSGREVRQISLEECAIRSIEVSSEDTLSKDSSSATDESVFGVVSSSSPPGKKMPTKSSQ